MNLREATETFDDFVAELAEQPVPVSERLYAFADLMGAWAAAWDIEDASSARLAIAHVAHNVRYLGAAFAGGEANAE